uniref:Uncharacterized protein n=1 Tax=Arundo donax TaxID=35708 RepID=A0A0A9F7P7_ARUDO
MTGSTALRISTRPAPSSNFRSLLPLRRYWK